MDINSLKLNEAQLTALAHCGESEPALAILEAAKRIYDMQKKKLIDGLCGVNDAEPKKDFRHVIGEAHIAELIVRLPEEAKKILN